MKLYHGEKYLVTESMINSFTWQMNLTVKNLHKNDFVPYICSSENALGKSDARIRLQGKKMQENYFLPLPQLINLWLDYCSTFYFCFLPSLYLFFSFCFVFNAKTFHLIFPYSLFFYHSFLICTQQCRTSFATKTDNYTNSIYLHNSQATEKQK